LKYYNLKLGSLVLLLFLTLIVVNHHHFKNLKSEDKKKLLIPPPQNIQLITFGYEEVFADSFWIAWAQHPEECGKEKIPRSVFESSFQGFKEEYKDIIETKISYNRGERAVCSLGWSFLVLDAITNLAPKFRYAYLVGTTVLSVLVEDHQGAAILYQKALKVFPTDWKLYYGAAYHYLFELDDVQTAARMLKKAGEYGAPEWVFSLSSKLYSKLGQLFLGVSTLKQYKEYLKRTGDLEKIKEVDNRILNLEKEMNLQINKKKSKK
jgi:tetratricopeptide (TPR) repeat protein